MKGISRNRLLVQIALFGLAVGFIIGMIYYMVGIHEFLRLITGINPVYLLGAILIYMSTWLLRSLRLKYLVNVLGFSIPYTRIFRIHTGQFFLNTVLPFKLGDVAAIFALRRYTGGARSAMTMIQSRILDLVTLVLCFAVVIEFITVEPWLVTIAFLVGAAIIATFVGIFIFHRNDILERLLERVGRVILKKFIEKSKVTMREIVISGRKFLNGKPFAVSMTLSFVIFLLDATTAFLVATGLGIAPSVHTFFIIIAAFSVGVIAKIIPLTPGAIGPYELGFSAVLILFGIETEIAVVVAVTEHLVRNVSMLSLGAPSVHLISSHVLGAGKASSDRG